MVALAMGALLIRIEASEMWELGTLAVGAYLLPLNVPYWLAAPYLLRIGSRALRASLGALLASPMFVVFGVAISESWRRNGKINLDPPDHATEHAVLIFLFSVVVPYILLVVTRYRFCGATGVSSGMSLLRQPWFQLSVTLVITVGLLLAAVFGGVFYFSVNLALICVFGLQASWFCFATRNWRPHRRRNVCN